MPSIVPRGSLGVRPVNATVGWMVLLDSLTRLARERQARTPPRPINDQQLIAGDNLQRCAIGVLALYPAQAQMIRLLLERQADVVGQVRDTVTLIQRLTTDNAQQQGNSRKLAELTEQSYDVFNAAMARLDGTVLRRAVVEVEAEIAAAEEAQRAAKRQARKLLREQRRGVELVRYRGDAMQAQTLERWLDKLLSEFGDSVLAFDADVAQVWGRLRVPHSENPLDKQIAATALLHDLVLVTRNVKHFAVTGVKLFNPFW